ncbi:MAG: LysR family transcriptional regulator [Gammaproteobacteria bacterium]|nr:LysR family transcriptional regulator [Gammaproteobacteria bacterium]MDH5593581.1 LysR family transcriptional regulator [Gammaproteobacteria bacterium]
MDTEVLRTFLEVNRTHHFGKAAENLFVTQSTVSARIRLLEEAVGVPVFTRSRNDIQLTHAGQRLLRYAENVLMTWNRARQEIAVGEDVSMLLSIAGMQSLWDIILQDWLNHTYQQHRDMMLRVEVLDFESIQRRLSEGSLDLAFVFDIPLSWEHSVIEIARVPLVLVTNLKGASVNDAMQSDYIMVDWGTSFSVSHARLFPDMTSSTTHVGLGRIALDLLLKCGGSAYMPESMVAEHVKKKKLFIVKDSPVIERVAYAVFPENEEKGKTINNLLSYFKI